MEGLDLPRAVQLVADVMEPDHLAVRGVEERAADAVEVEAAVVEPASVALGLGEDVLGADRQLLGFDDADGPVVEPEGVVGRTVGRLLLFGPEGGAGLSLPARPAGRVEQGVDPPLPGEPLGFAAGVGGPVGQARLWYRPGGP